MKENKWLKQFKENYEGKSPEAKEVADYKKETFNGANYVPWATMERLTRMQDPDVIFEKIRNENGGYVFTDSYVNENIVEDKNGIVSRTSALIVSHFVRVSCVFLGKEFIEDYPIQEQDYSAAKIYNQNLVNRALQRATAKVASRATGIGLRFYEQKDLQFDEDKKEEDKKPEIKKTTKTTKKIEEKVEETKSLGKVLEVDGKPALGIVKNAEENTTEEQTSTNTTSYSQEIIDLCNLIKTADTEKMSKFLQSINVAILKQHGFVLKQEDTEEELCEKLSHFTSIENFGKAITNMLGA